MFSALVPIAHVCRDDEPTLIEPVGDDAIADSWMFRRQRMNHFTVATTAIAIAIPIIAVAARWNHLRRSAEPSNLKTAGIR